MSGIEEQRRWVDVDPFESLLCEQRTEVLYESERRESAPPQSNPAKPSTDRLLEEGYTYFIQFRYEEAVGSYSAVVAAEPDHPTAHFDLAVCLERTEQWEAAANSFGRALQLDPKLAEAQVGLGACLLHLDRCEDALYHFECRLEAGDNCEPALFGRAVALQKLARYEEASGIYRELLRIDPKAAEPLANLIALSVYSRDDGNVFEYSNRLLRVNPQSIPALQGLALLAIRKGDLASVVEFCSRLIEVDPDSVEGLFNLRAALGGLFNQLVARDGIGESGEAERSIA